MWLQIVCYKELSGRWGKKKNHFHLQLLTDISYPIRVGLHTNGGSKITLYYFLC